MCHRADNKTSCAVWCIFGAESKSVITRECALSRTANKVRHTQKPSEHVNKHGSVFAGNWGRIPTDYDTVCWYCSVEVMGGSSDGPQLLRNMFFFFLGKISLYPWKFGWKNNVKVVVISSNIIADHKERFFSLASYLR